MGREKRLPGGVARTTTPEHIKTYIKRYAAATDQGSYPVASEPQVQYFGDNWHRFTTGTRRAARDHAVGPVGRQQKLDEIGQSRRDEEIRTRRRAREHEKAEVARKAEAAHLLLHLRYTGEEDYEHVKNKKIEAGVWDPDATLLGSSDTSPTSSRTAIDSHSVHSPRQSPDSEADPDVPMDGLEEDDDGSSDDYIEDDDVSKSSQLLIPANSRNRTR